MENIPVNVQNVYGIFTDFFGEAYTDLQQENNYYNILVYWPFVTVTNESGKSILIRDLYAKVTINSDGKIPYEYHGFLLNRATYNKVQFYHNYMHSHICDIPKGDFTYFEQPCLGTGPINNTIHSLKNGYSESMWMLFCQELSMYVTVESLSGGPYHRLENLGGASINLDYSKTHMNTPQGLSIEGNIPQYRVIFNGHTNGEFIEYYLKNGHLKLNYTSGVYVLGVPYVDFVIDISNCFIEFFNRVLRVGTTLSANDVYRSGIMCKALIRDKKVYYCDDNDYDSYDFARYEGQYMCRFKNRDIHIHITEEASNSDPIVTSLLYYRYVEIILSRILKTINYRYVNETSNNRSNEGSVASTYQKPRYI